MRALVPRLMLPLMLLLSACSGGPAGPPGPLFVNPAAGSDAATGTAARPLKTIGRALELVKAGGEVFLQVGTYRGEAWPLAVPAGVTIASVAPGGAVLASSIAGEGKALAFAQGGAATDLTIEDFAVGVSVTGGTVELVGLRFTRIATISVVALGDSDVTLQGCVFQSTGSAVGVDAREDATVSVDGGSVAGGGAAFRVWAQVRFSARNLTVDDSEAGLWIPSGSGSASLTGVTITNTRGTAVRIFFTTADVTLDHVIIDGATGDGIYAQGLLGDLRLIGGRVSGVGAGRGAVSMQGNSASGESGTLYVEDTQITQNEGNGLEVTSFAHADVRDADISGNDGLGIRLAEPASIKVRGTTITGNAASGVYLEGFGHVQSMVSAADLGTINDPGLNVIRTNGVTGIHFETSSIGVVTASGNTWNNSVQGASPTGEMTVGTSLAGPQSGTNFQLEANNEIWF